MKTKYKECTTGPCGYNVFLYEVNEGWFVDCPIYYEDGTKCVACPCPVGFYEYLEHSLDEIRDFMEGRKNPWKN